MTAGATSAKVGPYQLLRIVSQGLRGTVHEAVDPAQPTVRIAVRTLPASMPGRSAALQRMRRASLAATGLQHPNIVALHDCGSEDDAAYVATEFVDGETLPQQLARVGRLPALQSLALVAQLLSALDFAHRRRLVHGALHPGNLLVTRTGQLKVAGFGWAAAAASASGHPGPFGDRAYLAPEQLRGAPADARGDLYAAACVARELLAGNLCVEAGLAVHPLPDEARTVFDRALAQDPGSRYQSAADLSAALQAAIGPPVWERPPPGAARVAAPLATIAPSPVAPAEPVAARAGLPAVRSDQALSVRPRRTLSTRSRRALGAATAAVILIAALFMFRESAPSTPTQQTVQQPQAAAEVGAVAEVQPAPERGPGPDAQPAATVDNVPSLERIELAALQMPTAAAASVAPIAPSPAQRTQDSIRLQAPPPPDARDTAPALPPKMAPSARREAPARGEATTARATTRASGERGVQAPARARRSTETARAAQRSPIGLACDQAMAISREVCRAVRCVSPEFRRHPVCVRLDADRRARDAEREWRGSN